MEGVAGVVPIGKNKGLFALSLCPQVFKEWSVPVHLVEEMGSVNPSRWAVGFPASGALAAWELHVVLIVIETSCGIVARGEVDIGAKGRSIAIAVHVCEANSSTFVVWILDSNTV